MQRLILLVSFRKERARDGVLDDKAARIDKSPYKEATACLRSAPEGVGTTAAAAAAVGAAAYKTMSVEEKAKARHAALDSAKTAVHKWQTLDENSKAQWKSRAAGAAGKAADLWKRLPKN